MFVTNKNFGPRFGVKPRKKFIAIHNKAHSTFFCEYCLFVKPSVKKISRGVWYCKNCKVKFAGPFCHPYKIE